MIFSMDEIAAENPEKITTLPLTYPPHSIRDIPNSILAYFSVTPLHETLPTLDALLGVKQYKNVVVLLLDGMGTDALDYHIPSGFLNRHKQCDISSVFPSTTTAATMSIMSGLSPIEHGWLGWSCYFKEINQCVDLFTSNFSGSKVAATSGNIANEQLRHTQIFERIHAINPDVECHTIAPFARHKAATVSDICQTITQLCAESGRKFIYAYNDKPDSQMHYKGCYHKSVNSMLREFDDLIEDMCRNLHDTLLVVTADHGLIDSKRHVIEDYPKLQECLRLPPSIESRAVSLFVKPEYTDTLPAHLYECFGDEFLLMTKHQVLDQKLFGEGAAHPRALDFIGDYLAIAVGRTCLWRQKADGSQQNYIGNHAGLTLQEMIVPLIAIEC